MGVNKKDNHPSDLLNIIYANRLKPIINGYKDNLLLSVGPTVMRVVHNNPPRLE